jgi:hypothetical protein
MQGIECQVGKAPYGSSMKLYENRLIGFKLATLGVSGRTRIVCSKGCDDYASINFTLL